MVRIALPVMLAGLLAAGCDGLFTGDQVARFPLKAESGGYAPLAITLGPEMNPVALNLQAEYAANAAEAGKWNSYRATLTKAGTTIATGAFTVNNTSDPLSPNAQVISRTMMIVEVQEVGDYELKVDASIPVTVTLDKPQLELRRNIRRDPQVK
jgi:hypothetical protein